MATPKRPGRARSQLPTCYHEGFLEKKSMKDKIGRKLWTCLCGNSLFFFNNNKDNVYIEKLDLCDLVSVTDDCFRDRNLDAARFTLHMKNEDFKMIAPTLESRELWKGFLLSVSKLSVPSSLNLLPGQIHMMKEVIEKEKERQRSSSLHDSNLYVPVISDMPVCYSNVSRTEAEVRLERYPERGNLLLRPRQGGASFALTTREDVNGTSVFKHYLVSRRPDGGFSIDLETPISCCTLHDVITCMVEKTNNVLKPFMMEECYEDKITFVKINEENGELNVYPVTNSPLPSPPAPPPKPAKRDHRANSDPSQNTSENIYINDQGLSNSECSEDEDKVEPVCTGPHVLLPCPVRLPHQNSMPLIVNPRTGGEKKALKPPSCPNTVPRSQSVSDLFENSSQRGLQSAAFTEELKMLLKKKQTIQE